ncbi:putative methionine--tRNA ligase, cytoplasmic protein rar1 [Lobosporangium transversale]|uniref:methionine--tRNA ligase n=1 Tax=Lobosporangium transversale TaxID=64571 RepID=A0A1Y2GN10_9FUNG|nr:tRNA synthetases class I (M)-domain-containing protein [Lobosporangium transversale]KAF9918325.1 putative methionine--tRNA ligase, cytoplasmic protein rar1 [Lobosporangium transversale]ORZ12118.1 tRNA synthetases class I (M)-domain-containing protein [Lobosporangium transversale]|eukprot:XP_021879983.1 tRNA synthetases class I (M)-domain-containing protein [Lobosporangium transversale]
MSSPTTIKAGIALPPKNPHKVPIPGQRNVLITSALPYVNNVPHLGNIIGSTLSADVYARYQRVRGINALYICGTDEYGTATETKALSDGVTCQELCDKYHPIHKQCYEWMEIDFDKFGRTTTEEQTKIAQDIFMRLYERDLLVEDSMPQLYCSQCDRYLADRFVEGTCPRCNYDDARGDQCDQCGNLLNAIDLINPRCKLDGNRPVQKHSKHLFLDLGKLQARCEAWAEKAAVEGKWSANGRIITQAWFKEGLRLRCITRDVKWGTPVPLEGWEGKVFYVWFDAPIGYPSITATYTKEWEKWWKNPKDVKLYQFMGKDNVPFHTVIFPSSLIGTGEEWTLLNTLSTTEYLQYETGKFSKSRGVGIFGNNVQETGVPPSVWRYYLLSNRPETNDSQYLWKDFIARNNNELLANVGNFVNRVIKFVNAKYDNVVPSLETAAAPTESDEKLIREVNEKLKLYIEALDDVKIREALRLAMEISALGNVYLQENKIDNTLFAEHKDRCDRVVITALNLIYLLSAILFPYMPSTSDSIVRQLNAPLRLLPDEFRIDAILAGHVINKAEYLFKRIDEKMEDIWRNKYGGNSSVPEPDDKKKKKKAAAKAAAPVFQGEKPAEAIALEKQIEEQGAKVRELKTAKADNAVVQNEVQTLLALKKDLADLFAKLTV